MDQIIQRFISHMSPTDSSSLEAWLNHNLHIQRYVKVRNAVAKYSMFYDEVINWGLRNLKLSQSAFHISLSLINAIRMVPPIPTPIVLYRGVRETQKLKIKQLKPGDTFSDLGFASKSVDFKTAVKFLRGDACCCFQIEYDAGHPMMALVQSHFKESEFLTVPGEILEVIENLDTVYKSYDEDQNPFDVPITMIKVRYKGTLYPNKPFEQYFKEILDTGIDKEYVKLETLVINLLELDTNIVTIHLTNNDLISVTESKIVDIKQINDEAIVDEAEDYFKHGRLYRDFVLNYIQSVSVVEVGDIFSLDFGNLTMTVEDSPGIIIQSQVSNAYDIFNTLINGTFRELSDENGVLDVQVRRIVYVRK